MSWRDKVLETRKPFDPKEAMEQEVRVINDEVGISSPTSPATKRIYRNGRIDLFSKNDLGLRIDPVTNSITVHASKFLCMADTASFYTSDPKGLAWAPGARNSTEGMATLMPFNPSGFLPASSALLPPGMEGPARLAKSLEKIIKQLPFNLGADHNG